MMHLFLIVLAVFLDGTKSSYDIPCTSSGYPISICNNDRIQSVTCGDSSTYNPPTGYDLNGAIEILKDSNTVCMNNSPKLRDTIDDGSSNLNKYYVEFDDSAGNCYGIIMHGGECWGDNPNGGNYDCQGRCGRGCGSLFTLCSNWGRDCLRHDVCSWYFEASGGRNDINCGDEYNMAFNDWYQCCFTLICDAGCKGPSSACGEF